MSKMPVLMFTIAVSTATYGCAAPGPSREQIQIARQHGQAMSEQCKTEKRSGEFSTMTEYEMCEAIAIRYAWRMAGVAVPTAIELGIARTMEAAEEFDAGKITAATYERREAEIMHEMTESLRQDAYAQAQVRASQAQAQAAQQAALNAQINALRPRITTCLPMPGMVNCITP